MSLPTRLYLLDDEYKVVDNSCFINIGWFFDLELLPKKIKQSFIDNQKHMNDYPYFEYIYAYGYIISKKDFLDYARDMIPKELVLQLFKKFDDIKKVDK